MKLTARIARSLQADMQAELRDIERAVATGTRDAGRGLRTELRRQVTSAGLGQRLANSWRDKHYPNQKLDAASLVYTKAPQIIRAFDEGAVIRSRRGRFLAIPTENAPRKGTDGKRISPSTFPEHRFGPLRFVPRPSGPSLLVVDGLRASFSRKTGELRGFRRATDRARRSGAGSDHGGDVSARAAGEAAQAARRRPRGRALVGAAAGADRAAAAVGVIDAGEQGRAGAGRAQGAARDGPGAVVERNSVLPEKIPDGGLIILRDGDPGEPEQALGGFGNAYYQHGAMVEFGG